MKILSLFDGISCGQQALKELNIPIEKYYASEIDKYAIAITQYNHPDTIQLGDINNWQNWNIEWDNINLIIGGSPCQGFSFAGKQLNFNDPRSKLFFVFVDILNYIKNKNPDVKFLLENVRMNKKYKDIISQQLGLQPVIINSALLSAQNRVRLYWCNWQIDQPNDNGILLKEILEDNQTAYGAAKRTFPRYPTGQKRIKRLEVRKDEKSNTLTTRAFDNLVYIKPKGIDSYWRKLTPLEFERLQTLPDNYTANGITNNEEIKISNTQRYKAIGNGWTVAIIKHILKYLK